MRMTDLSAHGLQKSSVGLASVEHGAKQDATHGQVSSVRWCLMKNLPDFPTPPWPKTMTFNGFCFGSRLILQNGDFGDMATLAVILSSGKELDFPPLLLPDWAISVSVESLLIGTLEDLFTGKQDWPLVAPRFLADCVFFWPSAAFWALSWLLAKVKVFKNPFEDANFGGEMEQIFLEKEFLGDVFLGGENIDFSGEVWCCLAGMYSGFEGKIWFFVGEYCSLLGIKAFRWSTGDSSDLVRSPKFNIRFLLFFSSVGSDAG